MKRARYDILWCITAFCILAAFLVSCESRDRYVGIYEAQAQGARQGTVVLDLKANGDGAWGVTAPGKKDSPPTGEGEVPFTWYIKRGELRINTKAGGVIVGKINGDTITMTLPGARTLTFKKRQ
jgi:hypothetical protein